MYAEQDCTVDNIVIWVWSPIGYETYRSLKQLHAGRCEVYMIAARSFLPPEADASIGAVHHYFEQTPEQVRFSAEQIGGVLRKAAAKTGQFTLVVPQMANFWIRTTIESGQCRQVHVYDEGRAAYAATFHQFRSQVWMRGVVRDEPHLLDYFRDHLIDRQEISRLYQRGVKFYELKHPKLGCLMSFFGDAFPGFQSLQLPVAPLDDFQRMETAGPKVALLLLPPLHAFRDKKIVDEFVRDIESVKRSGSAVTWVVKAHPSNADVPVAKIASMFRLSRALDYPEFALGAEINPHREPAFFPFDFFVTYENSTRLYLGMLDQLGLMSEEDEAVEAA